MTVLFTTLGFQESFQLRSIFRHGNESLHEVIVIMPNDSSEKTVNPLNTIKSFCESINLKFSSKKVEINNIFELIAQMSGIFYQYLHEDMIVNLSGGMRVLHLGIILSLINMKLNPLIELDFENQSGTVSERLQNLIFYDIDREKIDTLIAVFESLETNKSLSNFIHESKATLWRRLKKIEEYGYIIRDNRGKISLTEKGKLILKIFNLKS